MAARLKQWIVHIGWTRVVVAVVLLGLTSLVVSALVSNSQPAPQQVAGPRSAEQDTAVISGATVNPVLTDTGSMAKVGMSSGVVQTGSYALRRTSSPSREHATLKVRAQKSVKSSTAKGLKQSVVKGKSAKAPANKTRSTKQLKQPSHSSLPSDTLFPELRRK